MATAATLRGAGAAVPERNRTDGGAGIWADDPTAALVERAIRRDEGLLSATGSLVVATGIHTGRSPQDKYLVRDEGTADKVWWGPVNQPMAAAAFDRLHDDVDSYLRRRDRFVQHLGAVAAPAHALPITVVSEHAWHALFSRALLLPRPENAGTEGAADGWTILHAPGFAAEPGRHATRSGTVVALSFGRRRVVIAGSAYAGEIKKSVFTILQFLLPEKGIATMHCSANAGPAGDVVLFFGLSGTGKTTLSIDPKRTLIGDDEHGWDEAGIFNFEGGCYAKVIGLSADAEPQIYAAAHRFGTVLENVAIDPATRQIDLDDDSLTENTRAAFPVSALPNASATGLAGHPRRILFLSADAFGVLPPVARLSPAQTLYWFLSGYTSKLAGTERGVTTPEATFSACFGAPFLPLPPTRYAALLAERLERHRPEVWLVDTGWTGGPYGVGHRMPIALTRAIVDAVLDGSLDRVPADPDPLWGFVVPRRCPGAAQAPMQPRATWDDSAAFDATSRRLAADVVANFERFAADVPPAVAAAGPRLPR